ncbi:alpha/beta hydrolase family protein [Duganella violaceipulchra]|uniref:Dipeptidyl aminopeptidase/acylaminoacyl peptidase n=1 Tax=Duganella violaceipulchra TaxID=2849652 RepID=A0AA41HEG3_9BURK|nr:alpha/beta fold hydrolase [Duganella violaceicalia]MBV6322253.1 prolyl oligopeptidase family serine peptidase [Duganella violaceicalia]MCP2011400.1 dipeptidyl aminopeptidase/acylaminoacyl peptidase [Duganella violaceicalia]
MKTMLASATCAVLPLLAHGAGPAPIPIQAFVQEEQYYNPQISPDGKHLAVTVRVPVGARTVPMLSFYSLPGMQPESTVRMPLFIVPLAYHWSSNSRLVVEEGEEVGTRERPQATGEIVAMDYDGTHQIYMHGYQMLTLSKQNARYGNDWAYATVVKLPTVRNSHVQIGSYPWDREYSALYDFDSRNAIRKLVTELPSQNAGFVIRNDGKPAYARGTDKEDYQQLWHFDDVAQKWTVVTQPKGTQLFPKAFSADDKEFIGRYSENGGEEKLVRQNVATGQRTVIAEDARGSLGGLMYGSSRALPIGVFTSSGRPRMIYLDPSHPDAVLHRDLSAQFPDATVTLAGATDDGNTLLATVRSDRDPGVVYLYDRKTNKADLLLTYKAAIDPDAMAARQPISFTARDGLRIDGYLTMPVAQGDQKPPLILLPHGGPHGEFDSWYFDTDAQFLASRGYAVLQVNYRGSGGRGDKFRIAGYRQWGGKIMDDLVDGVQWAVGQGKVDATRMCAYGVSFGGYAALMLAAREPDLFKCAVGYAGIYELPLIHKEDRAKLLERVANTYKRYVGEEAAELARFSPTRQAAAIKAGVLLIHGGKDKTAPKEHAFMMKEALEKVGHPPEWYYVDYEGHGFYDTANQAEVYQRMETFFAKYLGKPR